ncbi:hypothetical protein WJX84_002235 [Apatococcus fuscideae]|uniref:enoyl-[acyl-carrier-protein] reductase n=1 Tax=Apatococcus fuscideae TaxID=2026836 RepID=A0AAW1SLN0_9CHLO
MADEPLKLYEALGVPPKASTVEIRRAYRTRISQVHPDKGGNPQEFGRVQLAYEVLHDSAKREHYDKTGQISRTPEEAFAKSFAGGDFQSAAAQADQSPSNVSEQITILQSPASDNHTAGFEAWLRSRGENGTSVFTAESIAQKFGVVKGSYRATPLPRLKTFQAMCTKPGKPEKMVPDLEALPAELEWGQVLVSLRAVPVNPADLHTIQTGGSYAGTRRQPPFVIGHDGIGVVMQVAEGVRNLREGDWVIPIQAHMGTWRSLAVWKEADVLKFPKEAVPMEYAAVCRELCLAHQLLEDAKLKPGDCIILNGANSTVLPDAGSIEAQLQKFQARPKLGLDCIGGSSTTRISNSLHEGGQLIIYGCMSGTAPSWPSSTWIFQGIRVRGFNIRKWMQGNNSKFLKVVEALGILIKANKLQLTFTEYDMATELDEAVSHASSPSKNTKILLKFQDIGREY